MPAVAPGSATASTTDKVAVATPARRPHKTRYQQEEEAMGGPIQRRTDVDSHGHWRFGRMIGKGASGRVKLAHHMLTQQVACVKIVPKSSVLTSRVSLTALAEGAEKDERLLMAIEREICIMKLIDHPNLVKLLDVFETDTDMYMLLEYVPNGELFDHICSRGRLPAGEALHFFRQLMRGVDYCHRFSVAHRDLKPENLLLDEDMNIKIADFGMATFQKDDLMLETSCGSPHYAAPELISGKPYHGSAADIWSCGIILHALLTGRLPFDDPNMRVLLSKVKEGKFNMPRNLPYEAQDLLHRMIDINPERRIKMDDIFKHPFFNWANPPLSSLPAVPMPPTREELCRPIYPKSTSELAIVRGMRALWRNRDEDDILQALFENKGNWEKVFYWLLCKYQDRLRLLNGSSSADTSRSSNQTDNTPTPTKDTPNPVNPRGSLEARRLLETTPTPVSRVGVPKESSVPVKDVTANAAPPTICTSSDARDAPKSFLPVFDDDDSMRSTYAPSSTSRMDVDAADGTQQTGASSSPMKLDPGSGSVYAATADNVGAPGEPSASAHARSVHEVLEICPASTPKSAPPQLDLSLPHIEPLRNELIGLGLHLAIDTTLDMDLSGSSLLRLKQTPVKEASLQVPSTVTPDRPLPSTLPSTVMGLRVPAVPKEDLAMQDFFRALKQKADAAKQSIAGEDVQCPPGSTSPEPKSTDSTWVNVSPQPANTDRSNHAAGYRRRSVAPRAIPQRTRTIVAPQPLPSTSVKSPHSARITFSPDLRPRAEPEYRPSSSHQRRMTVLSYSVQPRNEVNNEEDKENAVCGDRGKLRRNTGLGAGYPAAHQESMRRVSEVAMPGAYSGMNGPYGRDQPNKRYQPPPALNLTNLNMNPTLPYMHPAAQHFHPVHQHPYQQPSAFFSPPPSHFGSPPAGSFQAGPYAFPSSQSPPLPTPVSTTGSETKSNWLANLFRGKGERYQLTSSMGIIDTRNECQRLLRRMEVYAVLEEDGGAGSGSWSLRCWTTESLTSPWFKTVKFRIHFSGAGHTMTPPTSNPLLTPITPSVAASPDPNQNFSGPTVITFTMEKGASATLRAVFARLRAEWTGSGSLRSPELGPAMGGFVGNAGYVAIYE